ncbi:hypothetical protein ACFP1Z_25730 [Streptomyces gamaensis]|uniref:Uncharacterized protein n=1 Tax=Streptomyces gamaensis TaxID=1763542 RepID=A0ABW0Z495_9ACTN
MPSPYAALTLVEVSPATVRHGDLIEVGDQQFAVDHVHELPDGGKRLCADSGASLHMRTGTRLFAMRLHQPPGGGSR